MVNKRKLIAKRGFTLIELLVAITILMVLVGMAILFLPRVAENWRAAQGGNQVLTFKYRIQLSSYKTVAVPVQVWDRMPHAEAAMTIAINLTNPKPELSTDPLYVRDDKPKGLLRWDVTAQPNQNGEKVMTIDYEFKMELDKNVNIGGFLAK